MSYPCHTFYEDGTCVTRFRNERGEPDTNTDEVERRWVKKEKLGPLSVPQEMGVMVLDFPNFMDEQRRIRGRMGR